MAGNGLHTSQLVIVTTRRFHESLVFSGIAVFSIPVLLPIARHSQHVIDTQMREAGRPL
jgi:hypothetical protein